VIEGKVPLGRRIQGAANPFAICLVSGLDCATDSAPILRLAPRATATGKHRTDEQGRKDRRGLPTTWRAPPAALRAQDDRCVDKSARRQHIPCCCGHCPPALQRDLARRTLDLPGHFFAGPSGTQATIAMGGSYAGFVCQERHSRGTCRRLIRCHPNERAAAAKVCRSGRSRMSRRPDHR